MTERPADPHTYNGFSAPTGSLLASETAAPPPSPPRRGVGWAPAWLAGALLVGIVGGLGSRTLMEQGREAPARERVEPAAGAPAPGPLGPPITVAEPPSEVPVPPAPTAAAVPATTATLPAAPTRPGPAFPCTGALRPSERMVCDDPTLAALDRRLNGAFAAAVRAGVPRAPLRAEQDRWVFRREAAARRSRTALVSYYETRIRELESLAANPG